MSYNEGSDKAKKKDMCHTTAQVAMMSSVSRCIEIRLRKEDGRTEVSGEIRCPAG
jgi:hypothetical protein